MKNIIYSISLLAIFFSTINVYAAENEIPVGGTWGNERTRSSVPTRPMITIDGTILSIYLADALENLDVVITKSNGAIVYQDCISSYGGGYTHTIELSGQPECYMITLTHRLGCINGGFCVGQ